ncbi:DUF6380 family protein [Streptomyces heilongjiangensis]|uniref:DUF6380 family protein n=1 Tax=Streptomyces heilongjiangensis TaxID=945052 RepID=A0ABW1BHD9_9ACTN
MDDLHQVDLIRGKRYATLRDTGASLTATACRGPLPRPGGPAGEGAR